MMQGHRTARHWKQKGPHRGCGHFSTGTGRLHRHLKLAEAEQQRLVGMIVDAVFVGDDIGFAVGMDGKALELVEDEAARRRKIRQEAAR